MTKKIHIGYHKTGTTFLQQKIFPLCSINIDRYKNNIDNFSLNTKERNYHVIKNLKNRDNFFYSLETFIKLPHDHLIKLLNTLGKIEILITLRNQSDLISSRINHKAIDFFLQRDLDVLSKKNNMSQTLKDHYNFKKLIELLEKEGHKVTYVWYEKLFSLDKDEIEKLKKFLNIEGDLFSVFKNNLGEKINAAKKNYKKYNFEKYFENDIKCI